MKKRRHRPSSIDVLPEEIRSLIGALRRDGVTIDEILERLKDKSVEVSRSALGRHVEKLKVIGERMQRSRDMATALVDRFGEQPDNRTAQLNIELMHSIVMDVLTNENVDPETGEVSQLVLDPEQAMFLARALKDLASAQKTDADRILKIKETIKKEAATAVEKVGKAKGLTADTVADIRAAVLGVV